MVPLIKRSTDILVDKFGEMANAEQSVEIMKYLSHRLLNIIFFFLFVVFLLLGFTVPSH